MAWSQKACSRFVSPPQLDAAVVEHGDPVGHGLDDGLLVARAGLDVTRRHPAHEAVALKRAADLPGDLHVFECKAVLS